MTMSKKQLPQSARAWNPEPYMLEAATFMIERRSAALFLDPGLGKTSITLAVYKVLKAKRKSKGMLVVAPLRPARRVWPAERKKWKDFEDLSICVLHGKYKEQLARQKFDIYVINYEGLAWLVESGMMRELLKKGWIDTVVFDELSKMKNHTSLRAKKLRPFLEKFERRYGLTGSPAANHLLGLFGQCYTLDMGKSLGDLVTAYRLKYFQQVADHVWEPMAGAEEMIFRKVAPLALRMKAEDYMKLPPLRDNYIPIELPDDVRAKYEEMEEEYLTILDEFPVTAPNAGVAAGKCRQICSGAVYKSNVDPITGEPIGGKREWYWLHDEKLDALEELIEELQGQQLLIAYEYQHELERFKKRFEKTYGKIPVMGGGLSEAKEAAMERDWNRGKIPFMFGHPQSIGHGMNLQESSACHVAWYTPTGNFELWDQYTRRLRRRGNDAKKITNHTIVAPRTVDMIALRTLQKRDARQNSLFQVVTEYHAARRNRGLFPDTLEALMGNPPTKAATTKRKTK